MSIRTFHNFPELPVEIQTIIWKYALGATKSWVLQVRILATWWDQDGFTKTKTLCFTTKNGGKLHWNFYPSLIRNVTNVMATCRMTRLLGLEWFAKWFIEEIDNAPRGTWAQEAERLAQRKKLTGIFRDLVDEVKTRMADSA